MDYSYYSSHPRSPVLEEVARCEDREDSFLFLSPLLLRGDAIFKKKKQKKAQSIRVSREVTAPPFVLYPRFPRVSKFRGAGIICMLLERLKN